MQFVRFKLNCKNTTIICIENVIKSFYRFYKSGLFPFYEHLPATSIETYFKSLLTKTSFSARTENKKGNSIVLKEEI
jgi:hypothetical protein